MKKTLIILGALALIIGGGALIFLPGKREEPEEPVLPTPQTFVETSLEERPFVSLTPSADGHWLTLAVSGIQNAEELEYEISYTTGEGVSQGALGGPFALSGDSYEIKILMGTESSGRYAYHEGVEEGLLIIRLDGGPGPRKFTADWHLEQGVDELTSLDEQFVFSGDFSATQYYITMNTIGLPGKVEDEVAVGPYGVFTSGSAAVRSGEVKLGDGDVFQWDKDEWELLESNQAAKVGVFIISS